MNVSVNQRVRELRKALNLTQMEFSKRIGITQTSISQIESESNSISLDSIIAIVNNFSVSPYWLLNGTGEMFSDDDIGINSPLPKPLPNAEYTDLGKGEFSMVREKDNIYNAKQGLPKGLPKGLPNSESRTLGNPIPIIDQRACAGSPGGFADIDPDNNDYIQLPGYGPPGKVLAIKVHGDSMSATIEDRDILICTLMEGSPPVSHAIYVICSADGASVKRFQGVINGSLVFNSDNKGFGSLTFKPDELYQLWEVKARITSFFPESLDRVQFTELRHDVDAIIAELRDIKSSLKAR
jgi:phage repressor protein C with HTH and peptisase S24 domain